MKRLININYIKKKTPILEYVSEQNIFPYLDKAQEVYLEQNLGYKLYEYYQVNDINDMSPRHKELLIEYIQPLLSYWTLYLYGKTINFKFTNNGISKQSSDYSQPADLQEIIYLNNNYRDDAEGYVRRLVDYMAQHAKELGIEKCEISKNVYNPFIPSWYKTPSVVLRRK